MDDVISELSVLLESSLSDDAVSIASKIKLLPVTDEQQIIKTITNAALYSDSSLKYATICKELSTFVVPNTSGNGNFKDGLLRYMHFQFDSILGTSTTIDVIAITTFIGNLFNVDLVSTALLRYWLSNLVSSRKTLAAENLLKVIQAKVRADNMEFRNDIFISSIINTMDELGIKATPNQKIHVTESKKLVEEGACNKYDKAVNDLNVQPSNASSSDNDELIKLHMEKIKMNSLSQVDIEAINTFNINDFVVILVKNALNNPVKSSEFAKASRDIASTLNSTDFKKCLITICQGIFENSLKHNDMRTHGIIVFIGELFNVGIINSNIIQTCLNMLKRMTGEVASKSYEDLIIITCDSVQLREKPLAIDFPFCVFLETIQKIKKNLTSNNDFKKLGLTDLNLFTKFLFSHMMFRSEFIPQFVQTLTKIQEVSWTAVPVQSSSGNTLIKRSFKTVLITLCQQNFEKIPKGIISEKEAAATCKLIGELFISGHLTSKIIFNCFEMLKAEPCQHGQRSSDTLIQTMLKNIQSVSSNLNLFQQVKSYFIEKAVLKTSSDTADTMKRELTQSKLIGDFCEYLLMRFTLIPIGTDIIEKFKNCTRQERDVFSRLMIDIAFVCPSRTKVFADFCRESSQFFVLLPKIFQFFTREFNGKLSSQFDASKPDETFWTEAERYSKVIESFLDVNLFDSEEVKRWLGKIFEHFKFNPNLAEKFLHKKNIEEEITLLTTDIFTRFPWLKPYIEDINDETSDASSTDESDDEKEKNNESTALKSDMSVSQPKLCFEVQKYLRLKTQGENVIFDHRRMKNCSSQQRQSYAKLILETALNDTDNGKIYASFVHEIYHTGWSFGNYLRLMIDVLMEIVQECFFKMEFNQLDWNFAGIVANFLSDLYVVDIIKLKLMNSWINKMHEQFTLKNCKKALKNFLEVFENVSEAMKKRDLKEYETQISRIVELFSKGDLEGEIKALVESLLRKCGANIQSVNKIPLIVKQIKSGSHAPIHLQNMSTHELKSFAKCCFDEIASNPSMQPNFLTAIKNLDLSMNTLRSSSSHKIFRHELTVLSKDYVNQQDTELKDEDRIISEFIAELFISNSIHRFGLQSILSSIQNPERLKVFISAIKDKVKENFDEDPSTEINASLYQWLKDLEDKCESTKHKKQQKEVATGAIPKTIPSTPNPSDVTQQTTNCDFSDFLENFTVKNDVELRLTMQSLRTKNADDFNTEVKKFFFSAMKTRIFVVAAKLCQSIENDLLSCNSSNSFRTILTIMIENFFRLLPDFDRIPTDQERDKSFYLMNFLAELYNIGWISNYQLESYIEKYAVNGFGSNHQLLIFRSVLKVTGLNLIKNYHDTQTWKKYHDSLSEKLESFETLQLRFLGLEVLDKLEIIQSVISLKKNDIAAPMDLDSKLRSLQDNNIEVVAKDIQLLIVNDESKVSDVVNSFINTAISNAAKYGKLADAIDNQKFKRILLNEIYNQFTDSLKLDQKTGLLSLIAELYNINYASLDNIDSIFNVLFEDKKQCNPQVDCVKHLIKSVGLKIRQENQKYLDRRIEYLNYVAQNEDGKTYRSKVYLEIIEWFNSSFGKTLQPSFEKASTSKTTLDLENSARVIEEPEKNAKDFMEKVWKNVNAGDDAEAMSELCKNISNESAIKNPDRKSCFAEHLEEFLNIKAISGVNGSAIVFVAELFKSHLISFETLENCLKIKNARLLPLEKIYKIISSINSRAGYNENVKLVALVLNLEDIAGEKSLEICSEIKEDIVELNLLLGKLTQGNV